MSNADDFFREVREDLKREQKRDVRKLIATIAGLIIEIAFIAWIVWVSKTILFM